MKPISLKSLISVYNICNPDLFDHYVASNDISPAQNGLRKAEMDDICSLVKILEDNSAGVRDLDNFYVGYSIPQIAKEFDLLRFGIDSVVDIEIKGSATPEKVERQLRRNAYYLSFLDFPSKYLYSYVCDTKNLYRWTGDTIEPCGIDHLIKTLRSQEYKEIGDIDSLFDPANYLVSPFNSTKAFVERRYFLTNHQENIKANIEKVIERHSVKYLAITGRPGTGKTLLLYDIVTDLMKRGKKVLVLHCATLNSGQQTLVNDYGWTIKPTRYGVSDVPGDYDVIVVDEAQRIYPVQYNSLLSKIESSNAICIFSYDETQCLSQDEIKWSQAKNIEALCQPNIFKLTEKIRTNREVAEFIGHILQVRYSGSITTFPHVSVSYCNDTQEAIDILRMFNFRGWMVPVYTPSKYGTFHYESYRIPGSSVHEVIGQEYDNIVAVIDDSFFYDENGNLTTPPSKDRIYSQIKMFYQIVTRTRKRLHILVLNNPTLLSYILSILHPLKKV